MRLKSFTAATMAEAMAMVRQDMGEDAIIVATETTSAGNIMVRAAVDRPAMTRPAPKTARAAIDGYAPKPRGEPAARLFTEPHAADPAEPAPAPERGAPAEAARRAARQALTFHRVPDRLAEDLAKAAGALEAGEPAAGLAHALEARFAFRPISAEPERPIILIGPPGAGKTAMLAKLAARAVLAGAGVDLVAADAQRPGSLAQLQAYAEALDQPLIDAREPDALATAFQDRHAQRPALIDAPAASPHDLEELDRTETLIGLCGAEPVLVLDACTHPEDAAEAAQAFAALGARRVMFAKFDVGRRYGAVLAAADAAGLAIAQGSASPFVGGGLAAATPLRLARFLIDDAAEPPRANTLGAAA
ncbi:MAG: AAA family ATPase [Maricaulaceae bacterium]